MAGPVVIWALASLLGCAAPAGFPVLLPVEAALPDDSRAAVTPAMTSLAVSVTAAAPEDEAAGGAAETASAIAPAPPVETRVPEQAPEAGRGAEALVASPGAPRYLAALLASVAAALEQAGPVSASEAAVSAPKALAEADEPPSALPAAAPTSTPLPAAAILAAAIDSHPPERIVSEAIDLDMEIVPVGWTQVMRDGKMVSMWEVGSYVASWHRTSAMPGQPGNMVITGHNNIEGSVFRRIPDLKEGNDVVVIAGGRPYTYTVETMFVVREKGAALEQKRWNAQWIGPFQDERLTLVTCYPPDGNSHRMIAIAKPAAP